MNGERMDIDWQPFQLRPRPQTTSTVTPTSFSLPLRIPSIAPSVSLPLRISSSPFHVFAKPAAQQNAALLLRVPEEVKVRILTHVPASIVASAYRATCQELHNFIARHETKIADIIEQREYGRLERHHDYINAFGVPGDLREFVESVRFFTYQRGILTKKSGMLNACHKWVNHIFRDPPYQGSNDAIRLARLAADLDWDFLLNRQVEEVYDLVVASVVKQPFFPGDLTMASDGYRLHHPTVPHELIHLLGLPKLSQGSIFFYYASKEWVRTAITKGQLRGLKKAAVLELVDIF